MRDLAAALTGWRAAVCGSLMMGWRSLLLPQSKKAESHRHGNPALFLHNESRQRPLLSEKSAEEEIGGQTNSSLCNRDRPVTGFRCGCLTVC